MMMMSTAAPAYKPISFFNFSLVRFAFPLLGRVAAFYTLHLVLELLTLLSHFRCTTLNLNRLESAAAKDTML